MKTIIEFLKDYIRWVDAGAQDDHIYSRGMGLCSNLMDYLYEANVPDKDDYPLILTGMFVTDKLGENYPFNGNRGNYNNEVFRNACYQNEARINWVRTQIEKA